MKKVKTGAVEKNIYCEERSGALRFVVQVSPLPKSSATFDATDYDAGLAWAQRRRVELLEQKRKPALPVVPAPCVVASVVPADILIRDILDSYRKHELSQLSGAASEASRLIKLDEWFGHLKLGQIPPSFLKQWQKDRLAGLLGSGRVRKTELTKHQRHYRKKHPGEASELPPEKIAPVSPQTVRHELVLLRRTITAYFREHQLTHLHGAWVNSLSIMSMRLPERPDPRETRLADEPLKAVLRELGSPEHQGFVLLAIATTLRRSELCSLRWEDVDFKKKEVKLRAPGHYSKTKVKPRSVPLMPAALAVLRKLGPKESGQIFSMTPSGFSQAWRRAADRAGFPDVRLHDMRREGISRLVELVEAPLQTVVAFSGHSDVGVLQRHYIKQRADVIVEKLALRAGAERLLVPAI